MGPIWIVVANRTEARFFKFEGEGKPLHPLFTLSEPDGKLRASELGSDRAGRVYSRATGTIHHGLDASNDASVHVAEKFAHRIAERLKEDRRNERFGKLAIVADPKFLGELRSCLDRETAKIVVATRTLDLTHVPEREIHSYIAGLITPAEVIKAG